MKTLFRSIIVAMLAVVALPQGMPQCDPGWKTLPDGRCQREVTEFPLHVDDGMLVVRDASFIRRNAKGAFIPELSFTLQNTTSSPWDKVALRFDLDGTCKSDITGSRLERHWKLPVLMSIGWSKEKPVTEQYSETISSLFGKVDECVLDMNVKLVLAENHRLRIDGISGKRVDFEEEKKEAALEAERKKTLQAAQKKKRAEEDARLEKAQAEERARAAEERRKVRAACSVIYQNTADKKLNDLTVREEQQVRACQALGLYPPQ